MLILQAVVKVYGCYNFYVQENILEEPLNVKDIGKEIQDLRSKPFELRNSRGIDRLKEISGVLLGKDFSGMKRLFVISPDIKSSNWGNLAKARTALAELGLDALSLASQTGSIGPLDYDRLEADIMSGAAIPAFFEGPHVVRPGIKNEVKENQFHHKEHHISSSTRAVIEAPAAYKIAGLVSVGGIVLSGCNFIVPPSIESVFPISAHAMEQTYPNDIIYSNETMTLTGKSKDIADYLKTKYGLNIVVPKTWGEDKKTNIVPSYESLIMLKAGIDNLPPDYLSDNKIPKEIVLISDNRQNGIDKPIGISKDNSVFIMVPGTFSALSPIGGEMQKYFGNQGLSLEAAVIEGFTKAYVLSHKDVFDFWVKIQGWEEDGGHWKNRRSPVKYANNPTDDLAISTALMRLNPDILTTDRKKFYDLPIYKSWSNVNPLDKYHEEKSLGHFDNDRIYTFYGETLSIMQDIYEKYGIQIINPRIWYTQKGPEANLQSGIDEISMIKYAIKDLPPNYLKDIMGIQIILVNQNVPEAADAGIGGGYADNKIWLITNGTFNYRKDLDNIQPERQYFGSQSIYLEAVTLHEFTHYFTEKHPDLLKEWEVKIGWSESGNLWVNKNEAELIHMADADKYPTEDLSVSVMLMAYNPNYLSSDRLEFFLNNPYFANWSRVIQYKIEHGIPLNEEHTNGRTQPK